jgi:uncharacterized surface protein with fasciclin (FAS1) repeats
MNYKLDGGAPPGPYMLFAVCDATNPVPMTMNQLNYHLAHGNLAYEQLPADGLLTTDSTDNIRITIYAGIPFVNGAVRLSNTPIEDYYAPTDVNNGTFFRVDKNIVTDVYGPLVPPNAKTILTGLGDATVFPTATNIAVMISALGAPYVPPNPTSWTFLVPVDSAFDNIPKYQKAALINGGTGATQALFNNHIIAGSHFAAPLSKISKENQANGLSQATYDYLETVSGHNLTMRYAYQTKIYYVENKQLTTTDYHYSDGVIHLISDFMYFDEISADLPPPTPNEFVQQYDTFSYTLKQQLGFDTANLNLQVGSYVDLALASGVVFPEEEVTIFLIWDTAVLSVPISSVTPQLVLYLALPGQYLWADLPKDTLVETLDSPASLRFNVYDNGASNYINGFATVVTADIKINKAVIHIIDTPFLLAPPCQPDDLTCSTGDGWINTTIAEDLKTLTGYSIFVGLIQKAGITFPSPCTLFIVPDNIWTIGANGPAYLNYFNSNTTAIKEYLQKFYIAGTLYPNVAKIADTNVQAADGTVYTFSILNGKSVQINNAYQANAFIRNDGIYYEVGISDPPDLFPFDIPPTPVEPAPVPTKPQGPPQPAKQGSSAVRLYGMQMWFYLFFVLAVLFLM